MLAPTGKAAGGGRGMPRGPGGRGISSPADLGALELDRDRVDFFFAAFDCAGIEVDEVWDFASLDVHAGVEAAFGDQTQGCIQNGLVLIFDFGFVLLCHDFLKR